MIVACLVLLLLASANGHMWLRTPLSRGGLDSIGGTSTPCNGLNSGGTVNTYEVGQSVNFQFRVNQHGPNPFYFNLLDQNNNQITLTSKTGFLPGNITNTVTAGPQGFDGVNVPAIIPDYVCSNCAIELSGMGTTSAAGVTTGTWYNCASVVIVPAGTLNQPAPSAVYPSSAPTTGGVTVVVYGAGFGNTSQTIWCNFGGNIVVGTWYNNSAVSCEVPPNNNPASSTVEVSTNGVVFSATGTLFTYTGNAIIPVISNIVPDTATVGTNVTIVGNYFYSQAMLCKFNGTISYAVVLNSTAALCAVPKGLSGGSIPVTVSVDFSPASTSYSFVVIGPAAPIQLALSVPVIIGMTVGMFFFGVLIAGFVFMTVTKRWTFDRINTPSGWQRSAL